MSLSINQEACSVSIIFRFSLIAVLAASAVYAENWENYDLAPGAIPGQEGSGISDEQWDLQYAWDQMEAQTGDNGLLGIVFDGEAVWVSGRGGGGDSYLYKFHVVTGELIDDMWIQGMWGIRDMCFDGEYVYGGEDGGIRIIDTYNQIFLGTIPVPPGMQFPRALAYDPATDHFYGGNFGAACYEQDREGNLIRSWPPAPLNAIYGMAWDYDAPDGPWLWIHDQTTPVSGCNVHQLDPATLSLTGLSISVEMPFTTSVIAGGLDYCEWVDPIYTSMLVFGQGNPDGACALEMYMRTSVPPIWAYAVPESTPVTIPANGGAFTFALSAAHQGDHSTAYDTWIKVVMPGGETIDTLAGPLRQWITTGDSTSRNLTQSIPGRASAGDYQYIVQTGHAQAISWDADTIFFEKLAVEDGEWVEDWNLTEGWSDPSISVPIPDEITLASPYPNPFNNQTTIQFSLPTADNVLLKVFDVQGREVTTLVNGWMSSGRHDAIFNAQLLPSGVYFVRLTVDSKQLTDVKKVMLVK